MARVIVDVMLKPEILDPQGQAIVRALPDLGLAGVTGVRQGKHFEIEVADAPEATLLEQAARMAETLLANPVIEDFSVRLDT